jgi:hypothetical protein
MSTKSRPVGYTNSVQTLTVYPLVSDTRITAHLWGGGGGGGGNDSGPGGNGSGGGFSIAAFACNNGDVLTLAVGGGGGGGGSGGGAPGGSGGNGFIGYSVFNTRQLAGTNGLVAVTLSYAWSSFMNAYAVWNANGASNLDVSTTVNFPITGVYVFQTAFDNSATVYLDGVSVASSSDTFTSSTTNNITVTGGSHTLRIVGYNSGGPAGVALAINSGTSFSGAPGGSAGPQGGSGGGGGGGGSTILLQNGAIQGVAAGGGGGGGAGNPSPGGTSPGPHGQTDAGYNGESGANHPADGGGGGGGGGGYNGGTGGGGNGGAYGGWPGASDTGGQAGNPGASWSFLYPNGFAPNGRTPGGQSGITVPDNVGLGGSSGGGNGGNGYAVIYMNVPGVFVNQDGVYYATKEVYVNDRGTWKIANGIYININGVWTPAAGQQTTNFTSISGGFGMVPRSSPYGYSPPEPSEGNSPSRGGYWRYGYDGNWGPAHGED